MLSRMKESMVAKKKAEPHCPHCGPKVIHWEIELSGWAYLGDMCSADILLKCVRCGFVLHTFAPFTDFKQVS